MFDELPILTVLAYNKFKLHFTPLRLTPDADSTIYYALYETYRKGEYWIALRSIKDNSIRYVKSDTQAFLHSTP